MMSAQRWDIIICPRKYLKEMQFEPFWDFCTSIYTFSTEFFGLWDKIENMSFCTRMYMISKILRGGRARIDLCIDKRTISNKWIGDILYWTQIVQHWCSDVQNSYEKAQNGSVAQIAFLASYSKVLCFMQKWGPGEHVNV